MHAGEQHGLDDGPLPGRIALTRGVVLILIAVVVGGFLLYRGVGAGPQEIAAADSSSTTLSDEGRVDDDAAGPATGSTTARATTGEAADDAADVALDDDPVGEGTDPSDGSDAASSVTTAPGATASTAAGTSAATSTTSPATTASGGPAGITVLVLNAASEKGVAGKGAEILDDAGYNVLAPKNADALGPSRVLFTSGNQAPAQAVAEVFGVDAADVLEPLDTSAPPISAIGDADVIVVIGTDGVIDVSGG